MEALLGQGEDERALVMFLSEIADVPPAHLNAFRSAPNWQARVDAALTVRRGTKALAGYDFDPARFEG